MNVGKPCNNCIFGLTWEKEQTSAHAPNKYETNSLVQVGHPNLIEMNPLHLDIKGNTKTGKQGKEQRKNKNVNK